MKRTIIAAVCFVAFAGSSAVADEPSQSKGGILNINGIGEVLVVPDIAVLNAGVVSRADTARMALNDNSEKMSRLFDELGKAGILKKDIQTSNFRIYPEVTNRVVKRVYNSTFNGTENVPVVVGYKVENQVTVQIREMEVVGNVITALVDVGANNMSNLSFQSSDMEKYMKEARQLAIKDAQEKANLYATGIGAKVDHLVSMTEMGGAVPVRRMAMLAADSMMEKAAPVSGGEISARIEVSTSWELDR